MTCNASIPTKDGPRRCAAELVAQPDGLCGFGYPYHGRCERLKQHHPSIVIPSDDHEWVGRDVCVKGHAQ